ncbi:MAG: GNAT family N-acetyltransferase [Terasakiella sp.]|uniref:GNAT family N-acetyltransferase n=1 Tax=unclassified Terasakiella TaxID=2614952 RepID=UPI003AFFC694
MTINWFCLAFGDLNTDQLYEIMQLRVNVFIVEQNCPYPDLDGYDTQNGVQHIIGYQDGKIIAYARLLPAGVKYDYPSIGRVITHADYRKDGLGHRLMKTALNQCQILWPKHKIFIQAQQHLEGFYLKHGFQTCSETYLEDNIPHIDMIRN